MLGSNPSADSVASTDPGGCCAIPFHLSAGTEPASGEAPKRKILGVRGQSPCATACFRSESRRPLIMRALACWQPLTFGGKENKCKPKLPIRELRAGHTASKPSLP